MTLMLYGFMLIALMGMMGGCAGKVSSPVIEPTSISSPTESPGLIVYGYVRDASGASLANVDIYRNYASYPAELIATTNTEGYYESKFYPIPGDEMVSVYAQQTGVEFEPEYYHWRHYYGYEKTECNFSTRDRVLGVTNK